MGLGRGKRVVGLLDGVSWGGSWPRTFVLDPGDEWALLDGVGCWVISLGFSYYFCFCHLGWMESRFCELIFFVVRFFCFLAWAVVINVDFIIFVVFLFSSLRMARCEGCGRHKSRKTRPTGLLDCHVIPLL